MAEPLPFPAVLSIIGSVFWEIWEGVFWEIWEIFWEIWERALGGSAGEEGVGRRGPGLAPVVGCLLDPSAEAAGIRVSSGSQVVFRAPVRYPHSCVLLQHWLNGASLCCACSCLLTELPCVLLLWHTPVCHGLAR
jgi:hypothetical protein